jgi:hypothetical protein
MAPNQQNPYEFIMADTPKKRGFNLGGVNSTKTRAIQMFIVVAVVLIIGIILINVLSSSGKGGTIDEYKLAAAQLDIIDITKDGATNIRGAQLATQSATTNIVVVSQSTDVTKHLAAIGVKKPSKQITAYRVKTYTKTLDDAKKNGNYDEVYGALLANRIDDYRAKLQLAYGTTTSTKYKTQLSDFYQQLNIVSPAPTTN